MQAPKAGQIPGAASNAASQKSRRSGAGAGRQALHGAATNTILGPLQRQPVRIQHSDHIGALLQHWSREHTRAAAGPATAAGLRAAAASPSRHPSMVATGDPTHTRVRE